MKLRSTKNRICFLRGLVSTEACRTGNSPILCSLSRLRAQWRTSFESHCASSVGRHSASGLSNIF